MFVRVVVDVVTLGSGQGSGSKLIRLEARGTVARDRDRPLRAEELPRVCHKKTEVQGDLTVGCDVS